MITEQQREQRKQIFIQRALSNSMGGDEEQIIKQAEELFEKNNEL